MHMACGLNFQPLETVRGLGKVIGKNLNMLIRALGHSLQKGVGLTLCKYMVYYNLGIIVMIVWRSV